MTDTKSSGDLDELLETRRQLLVCLSKSPSPAVERALETADVYVFLALTYLGFTDELYPEERNC